MKKIMVLGASGALGKHVAGQAVEAGHDVSVVVRTASKLPESWRDRVKIHEADIAALPVDRLGRLLADCDAVINTAGQVRDGDRFVTLVAHVVAGLEAIKPADRPVVWLMAGAGLLDIGDTGRHALELPLIRKTYWPHGENFARLKASSLDFRLLCPGPMVDAAPVGLDRLRVTLDRLPVETPEAVRWLPDLALVPVFASLVPEMIVPYADAAALMLHNLDRGNAMSRHRVGLALPVGMKGRKNRWMARAA